MKVKQLLVLLAAVVTASCNKPREASFQEEANEMGYAEYLSMTRHDGYWRVEIRDPWKKGRILNSYILVERKDSARVSSLPRGTVVYIPIERSVVFTAAHCQLLCWLDAADAVTGVCDKQYIHIPGLGNPEDCGDGMMPSVEKIIELRPQALLISPFENSGGYGRLEHIGVPIVETADYMETSALGRAEWMRFYGLLYGRRQQADSLFHLVDSAYQALRNVADSRPAGRSVLTERKTGSTWYVPGGRSSMGMILHDANAAYAFADDRHSGSLPLSFETILDKAGQSDLWLIKSNEPSMTLSRLLAEYHGYAALKAFQTGEVYVCDTGKKPYFEEVSFRPDYLLREVIMLAHPDLMSSDTLRYYERIGHRTLSVLNSDRPSVNN